MKRLFTLFAVLLPLAGCAPTRIVTVTPATSTVYSTYTPSQTYTTVTSTRSSYITTQGYTTYNDPCLNLDLEAVGAAFAQSSNVREFESLLNNYSYIINNLDLNNDGYVDYLRVLETIDGYSHVFLIQAVLGTNVYQDVATLVVENPSYAGSYVEIYGNPYVYGASYYVRPVFVVTPNIYAHLRRAAYDPWHSPWGWDNFPSHYKRPAPVHLGHYQAYVDTYMKNHHYCHKADYPGAPKYNGFDRATKSIQRNDYGKQHPEKSFTMRNADTPTGNSALERAKAAGRTSANASDMRSVQQASRSTTTTNTGRSATSSSTGRGTTSTATSATSRGTTSTTTSTGRGTTSTATTGRGTTTSTGSSATRTGSAASTSSSTSRGTTTTSSSSASRSTGSTSTNSSTSRGTTSTSSSVRNSGSTGTTTRTTTSSGSTSTVRRGSTSSSSSSSSTRSSSSSSSSSVSRSGSSSSSSASRSSSSSSSSRSTGSSSSSTSRSGSSSSTTRR